MSESVIDEICQFFGSYQELSDYFDGHMPSKSDFYVSDKPPENVQYSFFTMDIVRDEKTKNDAHPIEKGRLGATVVREKIGGRIVYHAGFFETPNTYLLDVDKPFYRSVAISDLFDGRLNVQTLGNSVDDKFLKLDDHSFFSILKLFECDLEKRGGQDAVYAAHNVLQSSLVYNSNKVSSLSDSFYAQTSQPSIVLRSQHIRSVKRFDKLQVGEATKPFGFTSDQEGMEPLYFSVVKVSGSPDLYNVKMGEIDDKGDLDVFSIDEAIDILRLPEALITDCGDIGSFDMTQLICFLDYVGECEAQALRDRDFAKARERVQADMTYLLVKDKEPPILTSKIPDDFIRYGHIDDSETFDGYWQFYGPDREKFSVLLSDPAEDGGSYTYFVDVHRLSSVEKKYADIVFLEPRMFEDDDDGVPCEIPLSMSPYINDYCLAGHLDQQDKMLGPFLPDDLHDLLSMLDLDARLRILNEQIESKICQVVSLFAGGCVPDEHKEGISEYRLCLQALPFDRQERDNVRFCEVSAYAEERQDNTVHRLFIKRVMNDQGEAVYYFNFKDDLKEAYISDGYESIGYLEEMLANAQEEIGGECVSRFGDMIGPASEEQMAYFYWICAEISEYAELEETARFIGRDLDVSDAERFNRTMQLLCQPALPGKLIPISRPRPKIS